MWGAIEPGTAAAHACGRPWPSHGREIRRKPYWQQIVPIDVAVAPAHGRSLDRGPWKRAELAHPWKGHSRACRYAGGDSLCSAALERRARSPKGLADSICRQTAQYLGQDDRAALREIHCGRPGRPREGGSRAPGAAEWWKRVADGKTCVGDLRILRPLLAIDRLRSRARLRLHK